MVEVDLDSEIEGIDIAISPGGSIAGQVVDRLSGSPLGAGIEIRAQAADGSFGTFSATDSEGRYAIDGLLGGSYRMAVEGQTAVWAPVVYPGIPCLQGCPYEEGSDIGVTFEREISGINLRLPRLGGIRGRIVSDSTGEPIGGARITVQSMSTGVLRQSSSEANGEYSIPRLIAGSYHLVVERTGFLGSWYGGVPCSYYPSPSCLAMQAAATPVSVVFESTTEVIDFRLGTGGTARGLLLDSAGEPHIGRSLTVELMDAAGRLVLTRSLSQGFWNFANLTPGEYTVRLQGDDIFESIAWPDRLCPDGFGACVGYRFEVTGGGVTSNLVFQARELAKISGSVVDRETGEPVIGAVRLWRGNRELLAEQSLDSEGAFEIGGLRPDSYFLTTAAVDGHADQIYGGGECAGQGCGFELGLALEIDYDQALEGLIFSLGRGGTVAGRVEPELDDGTVEVEIYDAQGRLAKVDDSVLEVFFELRGLPAGSYFALARVSTGGGYLDQV